MLKTIPGTVLPVTAQTKEEAFSAIAPVLSITGGLTLSQLCELTDLNSSTVQNWVKRGWVMNPEGKRYGEVQIARILLINLLRGSMQLEHIVTLMATVNGAVDDRSDDIIPDSQLYNYLCGVIFSIDDALPYDTGYVQRMIQEKTVEYCEPYPGARAVLRQAMLVMVLAYFASERKWQAEHAFAALLQMEKAPAACNVR